MQKNLKKMKKARSRKEPKTKRYLKEIPARNLEEEIEKRQETKRIIPEEHGQESKKEKRVIEVKSTEEKEIADLKRKEIKITKSTNIIAVLAIFMFLIIVIYHIAPESSESHEQDKTSESLFTAEEPKTKKADETELSLIEDGHKFNKTYDLNYSDRIRSERGPAGSVVSFVKMIPYHSSIYINNNLLGEEQNRTITRRLKQDLGIPSILTHASLVAGAVGLLASAFMIARSLKK